MSVLPPNYCHPFIGSFCTTFPFMNLSFNVIDELESSSEPQRQLQKTFFHVIRSGITIWASNKHTVLSYYIKKKFSTKSEWTYAVKYSKCFLQIFVWSVVFSLHVQSCQTIYHHIQSWQTSLIERTLFNLSATQDHLFAFPILLQWPHFKNTSWTIKVIRHQERVGKHNIIGRSLPNWIKILIVFLFTLT